MYKALSHGVQPVAVKIFPTHATPKQHAEFQREVSLLKSCRDGNIVQFLGASQTHSQTLMITEFMENGAAAAPPLPPSRTRPRLAISLLGAGASSGSGATASAAIPGS